jgi:hypothetical protein
MDWFDSPATSRWEGKNVYKNVNIHKGIYMSELVHKFSQLSCLQLHLDQRGQYWKYHNENRGSIPREVAIFIINAL